RMGHGEIVVVDDGTLTAEDRAEISFHIGSPQFFRATEVACGPLPQGGTWERLIIAVGLSTESYVIQLDSDTVTRDDIPEVRNCVQSNRSFTLGTAQGREVVSLAEMARLASSRPGSHVQDETERNFSRLPNAEAGFYIRGSSGFAG